MKLPAFTERVGSAGALVATLGCASCFPFLASLGSAVGLGFLASFESMFINTLLPIFAAIALFSHIYTWFSHRQLVRLIWGILGPSMVLATLYLFWTDDWSTYLFYSGLALMLIVSLWNLILPPQTVCTINRK